VKKAPKLLKGKSGRRGSNPRRPAWKIGRRLNLNINRASRRLLSASKPLNFSPFRFKCSRMGCKWAAQHMKPTRIFLDAFWSLYFCRSLSLLPRFPRAITAVRPNTLRNVYLANRNSLRLTVSLPYINVIHCLLCFLCSVPPWLIMRPISGGTYLEC
jgi:hypothetical protein